MKIIGKTDIGRSRAENQDTFRSGEVKGNGAWGLVCDGMGGAQNGRLASAVAADCMEEMLYQQLKTPEGLTEKQMLEDSINLANAEVFLRSGEGAHLMGTTVVCALVRGGLLHLAHVGDSRAYLFEKGKLRQVTKDHSMVQELVEAGTITSEEAINHPEKNVITRALGVEAEVEPSFSKLNIETGTIVMLCTDGLSNMVSFERLETMLASIDFYDLPKELVNAALNAGGDDNITVLLMQVEEKDLKQ